MKYLTLAGDFLGNLGYEQIEQLGENLERYQQDFRVIEQFAYLKKLIEYCPGEKIDFTQEPKDTRVWTIEAPTSCSLGPLC